MTAPQPPTLEPSEADMHTAVKLSEPVKYLIPHEQGWRDFWWSLALALAHEREKAARVVESQEWADDKCADCLDAVAAAIRASR